MKHYYALNKEENIMEQVKQLVDDVLEENTELKVVALANITEALAETVEAVTGFGEVLPHHVRKAIERPLGQVNFFMKTYEKAREDEVLSPPEEEESTEPTGSENLPGEGNEEGGNQNSNPDDKESDPSLPMGGN